MPGYMIRRRGDLQSEVQLAEMLRTVQLVEQEAGYTASQLQRITRQFRQ